MAQRKLGRTADQRKALLRNQVTNLIWYGRIETTEARAKEVRRAAERLITLAVNECDNTIATTKEAHNDKEQIVTIAMGGVGSDIAVDAADMALVDDEVKELPHLIALSKRMMTTIKLNMTFSMALNFAAIVLAIVGTPNPVVGALVHNAGSVLVITNSAFLLKWRKKK